MNTIATANRNPATDTGGTTSVENLTAVGVPAHSTTVSSVNNTAEIVSG